MTKRTYQRRASLDVLRRRLAAWKRYRGPFDPRPHIEAIEHEIQRRERLDK